MTEHTIDSATDSKPALTTGLRGIARENHPQVVCSKCGWNCALPSRRRLGLDLLFALLLLRPFRCRSCHRRHYRFSF